MKITNHLIANPSIQGKSTSPGIAPAAKDGAADSSVGSTDLYIPSQDWARIQALLHQQPEIRAERVAQAAVRLNAGYYFTADSADQTAEAMLVPRIRELVTSASEFRTRARSASKLKALLALRARVVFCCRGDG